MDRVGDARFGIDDGDVDVAIDIGAGRWLGHHFECDPSVLRAKVPKDRDSEPMGEGGWKRDLQYTFWSTLFLDDFTERLVDTVEGFRHNRQNVPAGLGQNQLLRSTLEQGDAKEILKNDDMSTDGALRDCQAIGRGGETKMLTRRLERPQGVQGHPFSIHPTSRRRGLRKYVVWAR